MVRFARTLSRGFRPTRCRFAAGRAGRVFSDRGPRLGTGCRSAGSRLQLAVGQQGQRGTGERAV